MKHSFIPTFFSESFEANLNRQLLLNPLAVVRNSCVSGRRHLSAWWVHRHNADQHVLASVGHDEWISDVSIARA